MVDVLAQWELIYRMVLILSLISKIILMIEFRNFYHVQSVATSLESNFGLGALYSAVVKLCSYYSPRVHPVHTDPPDPSACLEKLYVVMKQIS